MGLSTPWVGEYGDLQMTTHDPLGQARLNCHDLRLCSQEEREGDGRRTLDSHQGVSYHDDCAGEVYLVCTIEASS